MRREKKALQQLQSSEDFFWQAASKQTANDLHFPSDLLFNESHVSKFTTSHGVK